MIYLNFHFQNEGGIAPGSTVGYDQCLGGSPPRCFPHSQMGDRAFSSVMSAPSVSVSVLPKPTGKLKLGRPWGAHWGTPQSAVNISLALGISPTTMESKTLPIIRIIGEVD